MNYRFALIILCISRIATSQEGREAEFRVDFGNLSDHQSFWAHWSQPAFDDTTEQTFDFVFDQNPITISFLPQCQSPLGIQLASQCSLWTVPQDSVTGSDIKFVLNDGLEIRARGALMAVEGLPLGSYDIELLFHHIDAKDTQVLSVRLSDHYYEKQLIDAEIFPSKSTYYPEISSVMIPTYTIGGEVVGIDISSVEIPIFINGFVISKLRSTDLYKDKE